MFIFVYVTSLPPLFFIPYLNKLFISAYVSMEYIYNKTSPNENLDTTVQNLRSYIVTTNDAPKKVYIYINNYGFSSSFFITTSYCSLLKTILDIYDPFRSIRLLRLSVLLTMKYFSTSLCSLIFLQNVKYPCLIQQPSLSIMGILSSQGIIKFIFE